MSLFSPGFALSGAALRFRDFPQGGVSHRPQSSPPELLSFLLPGPAALGGMTLQVTRPRGRRGPEPTTESRCPSVVKAPRLVANALSTSVGKARGYYFDHRLTSAECYVLAPFGRCSLWKAVCLTLVIRWDEQTGLFQVLATKEIPG